MANPEESADESQHVQRARDKLKAQLADERRQFNPERLHEVSKVMRRWIERHQSDRVPLKEKRVGLWDANEHSAKLASNFVKELRAGLREEAPTDEEGKPREQAPVRDLRGRVSAAPLEERSEEEPRDS